MVELRLPPEAFEPCEVCHHSTPSLLLTTVWFHDHVGAWRVASCRRCIDELLAMADVEVEDIGQVQRRRR